MFMQNMLRNTAYKHTNLGKKGFFGKAICVRDLKAYMLKGNIPIVTVFEFHIINFRWKLVFSKILYW